MKFTVPQGARCELGVMLDGNRLQASPGAVQPGEGADGSQVLRVLVNREGAFSLAEARQIALRTCDDRSVVQAAQIELIKDFVTAWREELAWSQGAAHASQPAASSTAAE